MESLSDFLIRPYRSQYDVEQELGPALFLMNENIYERIDFLVDNESNYKLNCSLWAPKIKNNQKYLAILFCHGNCGNKLNSFEILEQVLETNICVIAFDFSGYSNSVYIR